MRCERGLRTILFRVKMCPKRGVRFGLSQPPYFQRSPCYFRGRNDRKRRKSEEKRETRGRPSGNNMATAGNKEATGGHLEKCENASVFPHLTRMLRHPGDPNNLPKKPTQVVHSFPAPAMWFCSQNGRFPWFGGQFASSQGESIWPALETSEPLGAHMVGFLKQLSRLPPSALMGGHPRNTWQALENMRRRTAELDTFYWHVLPLCTSFRAFLFPKQAAGNRELARRRVTSCSARSQPVEILQSKMSPVVEPTPGCRRPVLGTKRRESWYKGVKRASKKCPVQPFYASCFPAPARCFLGVRP